MWVKIKFGLETSESEADERYLPFQSMEYDAHWMSPE